MTLSSWSIAKRPASARCLQRHSCASSTRVNSQRTGSLGWRRTEPGRPVAYVPSCRAAATGCVSLPCRLFVLSYSAGYPDRGRISRRDRRAVSVAHFLWSEIPTLVECQDTARPSSGRPACDGVGERTEGNRRGISIARAPDRGGLRGAGHRLSTARGRYGNDVGCVATSGLRRQDGPPLASTVPGPPSCPATIRSNGASSNPPSSSSAFGGTCGMP